MTRDHSVVRAIALAALSALTALAIPMAISAQITGGLATAPQRAIRGTVLSRGAPLAGANVFDVETLEGSITTDDGRFTIAVADPARTSVHLVARRVGYSALDTTIALATGASLDSLRVELRELVVLMSITVQAGRYTATAERTATLTPLEVATTPGSNADITGAIKTLPGVQNVDEGTGLFVRGGDFTETRMFVDGAPLFTAYQFEAPTGSVAGTINPFLTNSITFSSGGFGAQWGNALSGVVDLRTQNRPARSYTNINASILGVSLGGGLALPHDIGLTATVGATDLRAMLDLNGNPRAFTPAPHGRTASALAGWDYSRVGGVKVFGLVQRNGFGVPVDDPALTSTFSSTRSSDMLVASWRDSIGAWRPFASASTSGLARDETKGAYDQQTTLRSAQVRVESPFVLTPRVTVTAGMEIERLAARYTGRFPAQSYNPVPGAPTVASTLDAAATRDAVFLSVDTRPSGSTELITGVRSSRSGFATGRTEDPRVSFAWMPRDLLTFTAAWGVYHQVADPAFLDRLQGSTRLPELRSAMAIGGVQLGEGMKLARVELWTKQNRDLVGLTRSYRTVAGLDGASHGADVFARVTTPGNVNLRVTYSGAVTRREDPNTRLDAPASFDVTHSLTFVAQRDWTSGWSAGVAHKIATGRPYTDVVSATLDAASHVYVPQYGAPYAERLPSFTRTDLSVSKSHPFGADRFGVAFIGINNLFNLNNTFGYTWSQDYSQRIPVRSAVSRTFFIGANLVLLSHQ
jgi:hypothetical protein